MLFGARFGTAKSMNKYLNAKIDISTLLKQLYVKKYAK